MRMPGSIADADRDAVLSPAQPRDRPEEEPAPMAESSARRAAVVEFEHVTKRYDAPVKRKDGRRPTPGAVNDLSLHGPGRQDLRPRRPVGLRQDDQPEDGQPADRADQRADPASTAWTPRAATSPSCGGASATSSSRSACSRTRRSATTWRPCRACSAGRRRARRHARTSCWRSSASTRRSTATASRASCPAASASASASPGPSPRTRRSCSWTSRSAPSTRSSATGSRTSSCASRRSSPRRSCS